MYSSNNTLLVYCKTKFVEYYFIDNIITHSSFLIWIKGGGGVAKPKEGILPC